VVLNANRGESLSDIAEHARAHNFGFAIYKDVNNVVADRFGAQVTPETYVIDSGGVIRYHGSIDDSQDPAKVTTNRLRAAFDAVRVGSPAPQPETKAFGCTITRVKQSTP
jgi:hypothetical protein